jgi:hypothetical protein
MVPINILQCHCIAFSNTATAKTGEVVGATGRVGSFLLGSDVNFVPVPRQGRPGSLTDEGCPIFVSVPATQISDGEDSYFL